MFNAWRPPCPSVAAQRARETPAQSGVPCTAEIKTIGETGKKDISSKEYAIAVHVEDNGEPYDAVVNQFLPEGGETTYVVGERFQAKADPDDRGRLLLFGKA